MKILHYASSLTGKLCLATFTSNVFVLGVAIVATGMIYATNSQGNPVQVNVIVSEDFEDDGDYTWGGGFDRFNVENSATNFSNSPHSGLPDGGQQWGDLVAVSGASIDGGPLVSALIELTPGDTVINFDGWLAAWTVDDDYTRFEAKFFRNSRAGNLPFSTLVLADGSMTAMVDGVTEYVDSAGVLQLGDAGADAFNWKHYVSSNPIPSGAKFVTISYVGDATGFTFLNMNDAYADNILITTSQAVPEPTSIALIFLSTVGLTCLLRRRENI
ncbi:MAG: PEP-CTERM sorting domain-containing protein [Planctomycetes bacterium]|nr:PEP-CTERM sorting domain-containing protein [Planctomycetota bacterium]